MEPGGFVQPMGTALPRIAFGTKTTPHMLVQRFVDGSWQASRIVATSSLELAPLAHALHYGASIFECFKAHRQPDGRPALFRVRDHLRRMSRSAERLCLPRID